MPEEGNGMGRVHYAEANYEGQLRYPKTYCGMDVSSSVRVSIHKSEATCLDCLGAMTGAASDKAIADLREKLSGSRALIPNLTDDQLTDLAEQALEAMDEKDMVEHPAHYTSSKFEVWDVIIAWDLPYPLSDSVKYIARAGKKNPEKHVEDLRKAIQYIEREIKKIETGE